MKPVLRPVSGFSLIELVATLVVMCIIAAVALPQLSGTQVYDNLGFTDRTLAVLEYAQKTAIAKRRQVCVTFTPTTATLTYSSVFNSGVCDANVIGPGSENPYAIQAGGQASYNPTPTNFSFNSLGQASLQQTINFAGTSVRPVFVESDTGYVHY